MQPVYIPVASNGTYGPVVLNYQETPFEVCIGLEFPATITAISVEVDYTFDDVNANAATSFSTQAFNPYQVGKTTTWTKVTGSPLTASGAFLELSAAAVPAPVTAIRFVVTGYTGSGTALLTVFQAENQRAG